MKLSELIYPTDLTTFIEQYWRKEPLYLSNHDGFDDVIQIDEINEYLTKGTLIYPFIRVVGDGEEVPVEQYLLEGSSYFNVLDGGKVFQLFEEGKTIVIQGTQFNFCKINELKKELTAELQASININIYITPSGSHGFFPHYDTHDVFVMQVFGSKTWRLYDHKIQYPLKTWTLSGPEVQQYKDTDPNHEIVMAAGDVLYFPAGVVHDAFCTDELSIHITIGASSKSNLDFIRYVIQHAEKDKNFRKYFEPGSRECLGNIQTAMAALVEKYYFDYSLVNSASKNASNDNLFIDYCCVENIDKLESDDLILDAGNYEPQNGFENDLVKAIHHRQIKEFILETKSDDIPNYKRSLKQMIRKGVLKINH